MMGVIESEDLNVHFAEWLNEDLFIIPFVRNKRMLAIVDVGTGEAMVTGKGFRDDLYFNAKFKKQELPILQGRLNREWKAREQDQERERAEQKELSDFLDELQAHSDMKYLPDYE